MPKPQLHALLVGVATNQYHTDSLDGCENDLKAMQDCLEALAKDYFQAPLFHTLVNEQATRKALVDAFEEHLIQAAEKDDVALFYFSGHGGQEIAPKVLHRYDSDGLLEGLVCYDSHKDGAPKLIDKELRWLICRLAEKGCRVITLFDCCHSGDNTRYELPSGHKARHIRDRKYLKERAWEELLVSENHPLRDLAILEERDLSEVLPEGKHISLSACLNFEVAFENPNKKIGYFTDALTSTLNENRGSLSYLQLQREVRNRLRRSNFDQDQTPNLYTPKNNEDALLDNFLYGDRRDHPLYGNIQYNGRRWIIDLGGLHGMAADPLSDRTSIHVLISDNTYEMAYVTRVFVDYSEIVWACVEQEAERKVKFPKSEPINCYVDLQRDARYRGYISGLMSHPLKLFLGGDQEGVDFLGAGMKEFEEKYPEFSLDVVEDPDHSSYQVLAEEGRYHLVRNSDFRAVVKAVETYSAASAQQVYEDLLGISRWTYVKHLRNTEGGWHEPFPIQLILKEEEGETHTLTGEDHRIELEHSTSDYLKFRIRCVNESESELFFSLLYLDQEFGIHTDFLAPKVERLDSRRGPFNYIFVNQGRWVKMRLPEHMKDLNWREEIVYFKLIVSAKPFSIDFFGQKSRAVPVENYPGPKRGYELDTDEELAGAWTTHLIEFRLQNPFYEEE